MTCTTGILKNKLSNCEAAKAGGIEVNVYVGNRTDIDLSGEVVDITNVSKITTFKIKTGKKAYLWKGFKSNIKPKSEAVITDDFPTRWKQTVEGKFFEATAADLEELNGLDDLFMIIERVDKVSGGDGDFLCLGHNGGLYLSAMNQAMWENSGAIMATFASRDLSTEKFMYQVVDAGTNTQTKAMLDALLVTQV